MTSSAVTSRYAGALVDVVTGGASPADPQQTAAQLRSFESVLKDSAELRNAMASPAVPTGRKRAVAAAIAARLGLSPVARNFVFALIDHRRVEALGDMIDEFETQVDERLGFLRAEITSAAPLDDAQRAELVSNLALLTGKQVRPRYGVDRSLIGGVVARVGSTVYDGSVRGRLRALERRLTAD